MADLRLFCSADSLFHISFVSAAVAWICMDGFDSYWEWASPMAWCWCTFSQIFDSMLHGWLMAVLLLATYFIYLFVSTAIALICMDGFDSYCIWALPMVRSWCMSVSFLIQCCIADCWLFFSAGNLDHVSTGIPRLCLRGIHTLCKGSSPMMRSWCMCVRFLIQGCMAYLLLF